MKKLLSVLLTIVMFVTILATILLFSIRGMISSNNIEEMYDAFAEEGVIEDIIGFDSSEFEDVMEDNECKKILAELTSGYVKYTLFITNEKPDIEPLLEYLKEDDSLTDAEIEDMIDEFEESIEAERDSMDDEEAAEVIKLLFSNGLILGLIIVTLACIFINYALSKDVKKVVRKIAVIDVLSGLVVFGAGSLLIEAMKQEADMPVEIVEAVFGTFKTNGIICLILGVILFIAAKRLATMLSSIKHSNQAIEQLDNSVIK